VANANDRVNPFGWFDNLLGDLVKIVLRAKTDVMLSRPYGMAEHNGHAQKLPCLERANALRHALNQTSVV